MKILLTTLCLTSAVLLGSVGVSFSADFQKGVTAYDSGDYATALREWTPLAEQGLADAQYNLGQMYAEGKGVSQNHKSAVKWYRLSAEQGNADAQFNLGLMYRKGQGVPQDDRTAVKWYRLSAEQGNDSAQTELGFMYEEGKGVPQDYKTAVKWYTLAAEQGDAVAQTAVGLMYAQGHGVVQDIVYAHMWYNIASSNGDVYGGKLRNRVAKQMTPSQIETAQKLARECVERNFKDCGYKSQKPMKKTDLNVKTAFEVSIISALISYALPAFVSFCFAWFVTRRKGGLYTTLGVIGGTILGVLSTVLCLFGVFDLSYSDPDVIFGSSIISSMISSWYFPKIIRKTQKKYKSLET